MFDVAGRSVSEHNLNESAVVAGPGKAFPLAARQMESIQNDVGRQ